LSWCRLGGVGFHRCRLACLRPRSWARQTGRQLAGHTRIVRGTDPAQWACPRCRGGGRTNQPPRPVRRDRRPHARAGQTNSCKGVSPHGAPNRRRPARAAVVTGPIRCAWRLRLWELVASPGPSCQRRLPVSRWFCHQVPAVVLPRSVRFPRRVGHGFLLPGRSDTPSATGDGFLMPKSLKPPYNNTAFGSPPPLPTR